MRQARDCSAAVSVWVAPFYRARCLAQVVAGVAGNGGQASDYLKEVGGKQAVPPSASLPVLLVPSCPTSVELLKSAHVVIGSEMTTKFEPHPDTQQVRHVILYGHISERITWSCTAMLYCTSWGATSFRSCDSVRSLRRLHVGALTAAMQTAGLPLLCGAWMWSGAWVR